MCCNQSIGFNASFVPLGNPQDAGKVLRRDAPAFAPTIDRNGSNAALAGDFIPLSDQLQKVFDWFAHALNNDYYSHKVKRLNQ